MAEQPAFKYKVGPFSVAVFLNEIDGRKVPSIAVEKSFTRDDGKTWNRQKMSLLNTTEIDKLICALQETKRVLYTEDFQ